ncbi:DUF2321 domain-containing protein [Bacillus cereus]
MSRAGYDTAQICKNGHVITNRLEDSPEHSQSYCSKCGEETITCCLNCSAKIRGKYHVPGVAVLSTKQMKAPRFCYQCGNAYPWTERALSAAKELTAELDELTEEEKNMLNRSIDELVQEGPQVVVATTRFKKIMKKLGDSSVVGGFRDILVDVASEDSKKAIMVVMNKTRTIRELFAEDLRTICGRN